MQRWWPRLRQLAALHSIPKPHHHHHHHLHRHCHQSIISNRLLHTSPNWLHQPQIITRSLTSPNLKLPLNAPSFPHLSHSPLSLTQVRHITAKQRKRKLKSRKPMTPITSKVKKIKMKFYSSFKGRFRVMNDGQIRRWKEGKRHNAHSKSKKSKRRLRQPGIVPPAYAKSQVGNSFLKHVNLDEYATKVPILVEQLNMVAELNRTLLTTKNLYCPHGGR